MIKSLWRPVSNRSRRANWKLAPTWTKVFLLSVLAMPIAGLAQETKPRVEDPGDAMDLVFFRDSGPVLIRIHAKIGEQTVQAKFQGYLKKIFDYLDRNNDGKLDAKELQGTPKATFMIQQVLNGGLFINNNLQNNLTMGDLGTEGGATITFAEFEAYYRKNNVRAFQAPNPVQAYQPPNLGLAASPPIPAGNSLYGQASAALFKHLDLNKDGKLSKEELAVASVTLRKFDLDDDELITAQELVPGANFFGNVRLPAALGRTGTGAMSPSFFLANSPGARDRLPLLLLSQFDKDKNTRLSQAECGFDPKLFAKLDKNNDGELDAAELADWLKEAGPDLEFVANLVNAGRGEATIELKQIAHALKNSVKKGAAGSFLLQLGDAEISLLGRGFGGQVGRVDQNQFFIQQFRLADSKQRGFLEMADVQGPQYQFLRNVFPVADRNGDGKLTIEELQAYVGVFAEGVRVQASLATQDQGRTLFQILDANRDGRLSLRELRNGWQRLAPRDLDGDGCISANEIPRQFQIVVAQGPAQNLNFTNFGDFPGLGGPGQRAALPRTVPEWFRKMDVNGDGDVSPREFLGTREEFDRIDEDHDGLIDPQEAIRYDAKIRQKK